MVVDHVEDHAEAGLVKSLDHLLELLDAGNRIVRICRERALYSIVVERLVTPIVLVVLKTGLVDCSEVGRRKELHICHSDLLEVVYTGCKAVRILCTLLCKSKILTLVAYSGSLMNREIPVLKLIDDDVGRLDLRTLVLRPSFWICLGPVDYSTAHSVHTHRFGGDTLCLLKPFTVLLHLECVERTLHIFLYNRFPEAVLGQLHIHDLECCFIGSRMVESQLSGLSVRSPHCKFCLVAQVDTLLKRSLRYDDSTIRCTRGHSSHCKSTHQKILK